MVKFRNGCSENTTCWMKRKFKRGEEVKILAAVILSFLVFGRKHGLVEWLIAALLLYGVIDLFLAVI